MNFSFTKFLLALACGALSMQAAAGVLDDFQAAREQGKSTTLLHVDNDSLLLRNQDGFYSSGLQIAQQYALHEATQTTVFGWQLGQDFYTASDIKVLPQFISPLDHPYAGWLYGGFFKDIRRDDGSGTKLGLDIGCLGPCAGGEWAQKNLHRLLNQPLPQGWSTQVRNEVGAVLYGDYTPARWLLGSSADLTPALHGRFGNIFTDAGAGLTLRVGRLNSPAEKATLHGLVRLDAKAVGYNATLQGGYFSKDNPHTVDPKRFTGEGEVGLVWNDGTYGISASVVRRSNEIHGLPNNIGSQNFARLVFSYTP
jgi:lipid A 3-O-deacylase